VQLGYEFHRPKLRLQCRCFIKPAISPSAGPARVWIGRVLASILLEEKGRVLLLKSLKGEDDAEVAAFLRLHINHQFAPENEKGKYYPKPTAKKIWR
jgi:hypothetical protein